MAARTVLRGTTLTVSVEKAGGSYLVLVATAAALTFLHFAFRPVLEAWPAGPNLLVCAVLLASLRVRPGVAAAVGFFLGLLEDAMAVTNFGVAATILLAIGFLGSRVKDQFVGEEPLFMGTYIFLGTWLFQVVTYLLTGSGGRALRYMLLESPLDALATTVVGYLILLVIRGR